ncbi:RagB/SusD family nutrient uptake outer membrane protein [Bacteroides fragilis]|nr:RagB/SusD family nutrient uptake outer membrane protein [Bacteroides fragilis]
MTTGDHQATGNSDLAIAQTALQPLINQFSLLDNFSEVFSKKANDEIIFAIRFKDGEATNWAGPFIYYGNIFEGQRYGRDGKLMQDTLDLKGTVGQFFMNIRRHFGIHMMMKICDATLLSWIIMVVPKRKDLALL